MLLIIHKHLINCEWLAINFDTAEKKLHTSIARSITELLKYNYILRSYNRLALIVGAAGYYLDHQLENVATSL